MSLHSLSSVNGEGSTPKDPLYKILDELRSLELWKEKQERKEKGKERVEEISQDEREKIREKKIHENKNIAPTKLYKSRVESSTLLILKIL